MARAFPVTHEQEPTGAALRGCLPVIGSALITCFMLFINGSIVLAFLTVLASLGSIWTHDLRFVQFLLFVVPVLLAVIEWIMIDYVRSRFRHNSDN